MKNGEYTLVIAPEGYPGKRYRGRYCYEHHLVWWLNTGEVVLAGELIHHKDEDKRNNVFLNLEKMSKTSHDAHHSNLPIKSPVLVSLFCFWCGSAFTLRKHVYVCRVRANGHADVCCGRSCQVKKQQHDKKVKKEN